MAQEKRKRYSNFSINAILEKDSGSDEQSQPENAGDEAMITEEEKEQSDVKPEVEEAVNASTSAKSGSSSKSKMCSRCANHNKFIPLKGHKYDCKYRRCVCVSCTKTVVRQRVMAVQMKLWRSKKPEPLVDDNTKMTWNQNIEDDKTGGKLAYSYEKHKRQKPTCSKCKNHNRLVPSKGHKRVCPFLYCSCASCHITKERRKAMAHQMGLSRSQHQEEGAAVSSNMPPSPLARGCNSSSSPLNLSSRTSELNAYPAIQSHLIENEFLLMKTPELRHSTLSHSSVDLSTTSTATQRNVTSREEKLSGKNIYPGFSSTPKERPLDRMNSWTSIRDSLPDSHIQTRTDEYSTRKAAINWSRMRRSGKWERSTWPRVKREFSEVSFHRKFPEELEWDWVKGNCFSKRDSAYWRQRSSSPEKDAEKLNRKTNLCMDLSGWKKESHSPQSEVTDLSTKEDSPMSDNKSWNKSGYSTNTDTNSWTTRSYSTKRDESNLQLIRPLQQSSAKTIIQVPQQQVIGWPQIESSQGWSRKNDSIRKNIRSNYHLQLTRTSSPQRNIIVYDMGSHPLQRESCGWTRSSLPQTEGDDQVFQEDIRNWPKNHLTLHQDNSCWGRTGYPPQMSTHLSLGLSLHPCLAMNRSNMQHY